MSENATKLIEAIQSLKRAIADIECKSSPNISISVEELTFRRIEQSFMHVMRYQDVRTAGTANRMYICGVEFTIRCDHDFDVYALADQTGYGGTCRKCGYKSKDPSPSE